LPSAKGLGADVLGLLVVSCSLAWLTISAKRRAEAW